MSCQILTFPPFLGPPYRSKSVGIPSAQTNGKVVFLQHGLKCTAVDWTVQGLAYMLVDLGYDVWLGNFRGNCFSKGHIELKTTDDRFW